MKKIICVLSAALLLTSCSLADKYVINEKPEETVQSAATETYSDTDGNTAETEQDIPEEMGDLKLVTSDGAKVVSYDVCDGRVTATLDNGNNIYVTDIADLSKTFLDAVVAGDKDSVAGYINTSAELLGFFDTVRFDSCYRIAEIYCNHMEYKGSVWYETEVRAYLNVLESNDPRFPVGENEYRIVSGDASTAVCGFSLVSTQNTVDTDENALTQMCYNYTRDFGFDDVKNGDFSALKNKDGFLSTAVMWAFDCTEKDAYTEDELAGVMESTLGMTDIEWTNDKYYDSYCESNKTDGKLYLPGKGRFWYYTSVESLTDSETVLVYYADGAGLIPARKVKFGYSKNSDGTYRLLSVETIENSESELAMGSV